MNINKIIWLTGIIEGEGTIGLYKYKRIEKGKEHGWRINTFLSVCNTDPAIIWEVYKIVKEEFGINMTIFTRNNPNNDWSIAYSVVIRRMKDNYDILKEIYPYLIGSKKIIAEMTMQFIESRKFGNTREPYSREEENLYLESKKMTQKGKGRKLPESSETLRQTLSKISDSEDIVQTSMKVGDEIPQEFQ